jgi:arsenate reductase (thioredoxin)
MRKILFICTGNSCRSQMAEAIVNTSFSQTWQAFSAGTNPIGFVHPLVINVLAEIGINHMGRSKSVDEFRDKNFDVVVTVCDAAAEECPVWLGKGKRVHISFPDPVKASGSSEEILAVFRSVRDDIQHKIGKLLLNCPKE